MVSSISSIDAALYRLALYLYPPSFRREFSVELALDFEEGRQESLAAGATRIWTFRAYVWRDLAATVVLEWCRTGWPVIIAGAVLCPLAAVSLLAQLWRVPRLVITPETPDADLIGLGLITSTVFLVIALTIVVTIWSTRLMSRRRT